MQSLTSLLATAILVISLSGCSYLFWPRADEYLQKAKGATGVETILNLTTMLEASAKAARGGKGYDQSLNDLHNQFHALDNALLWGDQGTGSDTGLRSCRHQGKGAVRHLQASVEIQR